MLKIFEIFTKEYYKHHFVILHIPTNQYVRVRFSMYDLSPRIELDTKPTYFFYFPWHKWHKTQRYINLLKRVEGFYIGPEINELNELPSMYKRTNFEVSEFELIEVDGSQVL